MIASNLYDPYIIGISLDEAQCGRGCRAISETVTSDVNKNGCPSDCHSSAIAIRSLLSQLSSCTSSSTFRDFLYQSLGYEYSYCDLLN